MRNSNGRITRRELIKSSVAAGGLAIIGAPSISAAQQAAATTTAGTAPYSDLAERLGGSLITPGNERYDDARKVFNDMIDRRPAAIARCSGAADVMDVVKYAREKDIPVTVRGGGHNVAGRSVRDGAITIDLAPMHGVRVDPVRRRVRAQGGVRLGGLDRETLAVGLVTPSGTVTDTGIAGLTLGGGLGWLMRKHGLTIDNLISADVVTADGKFIIASKNEHPDLFWALRGGGGNFGVVTAFEYQLYEAEDTTAGIIMFPGERLKDLLHFYRDFTSNAPDSVMTMGGAMPGIPGTPTEGGSAAFIAVCHSGSHAEGERLVRPIKEFGTSFLDTIAPMPFADVQKMFDAGSPPGMRHYWRSSFMDELSDSLIDTFVDNASGLPLPASMIVLEHLGGAMGRVGPTDTAFSNRNAQYNASLLCSWPNADEDEENIAWTRSIGDKLRTFGSGGSYVNYTSDEGEASVRAASEVNLDRLIAVKREYDPTNMFNANRAIVP